MSMPNEHGTFCWYSIQTSNVDVAGSFYIKAFGWKHETFTMPGMAGPMQVFGMGKGVFCDISLNSTPRAPSHWMPYIAVTDLTQTLKTITEYGGEVVKQKFNMPTIGHSAVAKDPSGTYFMPFEPERPNETISVMDSTPGSVCWNELMISNVKSVLPFYEKVFKWSIESVSMDSNEYYVAKYGGKDAGPAHQIAGFMEKPKEIPSTHPMWLSMVSVNSVKDSLTLCNSLGAKTLMGVTEIHVGKFALLTSPTGEAFYLFESNENIKPSSGN
jgi:predicted enzyme related to lactoylglutathione lyase